MSTHDKTGKEYAKLSNLKEGDVVLLDDGFTCIGASLAPLQSDYEGNLYFHCAEGKHYLDGQLGFHEYDKEHLVGVYGPIEQCK